MGPSELFGVRLDDIVTIITTQSSYYVADESVLSIGWCDTAGCFFLRIADSDDGTSAIRLSEIVSVGTA